MSNYEGADDYRGDDPVDLKREELELDARDEAKREEEEAAAAGEQQCPGVIYSTDEEPEHCGNDCRGIYHEDSGEHDDPQDCVHCECCGCNSCAYARVG
jgi:hypothetical protein